jgi:hypothetical protein
LKKFYSQELSSRIGEETKFEVLRLEGEIAENVIKNIENAKKYLKPDTFAKSCAYKPRLCSLNKRLRVV